MAYRDGIALQILYRQKSCWILNKQISNKNAFCHCMCSFFVQMSPSDLSTFNTVFYGKLSNSFPPLITADSNSSGFLFCPQGGEVHRPGNQARQCWGLVQVGGEDSGGRREGHGCHSPHAVQTGIRPPCQPSQLRQAWPQSPGQYQKGELTL